MENNINYVSAPSTSIDAFSKGLRNIGACFGSADFRIHAQTDSSLILAFVLRQFPPQFNCQRKPVDRLPDCFGRFIMTMRVTERFFLFILVQLEFSAVWSQMLALMKFLRQLISLWTFFFLFESAFFSILIFFTSTWIFRLNLRLKRFGFVGIKYFSSNLNFSQHLSEYFE